MTTLELNASLLRELSYIADDELLLQKAIQAIKTLRKEKKAAVKPYTMEELDERIAKSEADIKAGRGISSDEMHSHMKAFISEL